jgi:hypothetical protein
MTMSIGSPVTGATITGLTNPTHTLTVDTPPDANAKQVLVTTLGGTQTNARTHTLSDPFSLTFVKPKVLKTLPPKNIAGLYPSVPMNTYTTILRKGVYIDASSNIRQMTIRVTADVPAGADASDAVNIKSALSLLGGVLWAEGNDYADLLILGNL